MDLPARRAGQHLVSPRPAGRTPRATSRQPSRLVNPLMAGGAVFLLGVTCPLGIAAGGQLPSLTAVAEAGLTSVVDAFHVLVAFVSSR